MGLKRWRDKRGRGHVCHGLQDCYPALEAHGGQGMQVHQISRGGLGSRLARRRLCCWILAFASTTCGNGGEVVTYYAKSPQPLSKQEEYAEKLKQGIYVGVRKCAKPPTQRVITCVHPTHALAGAGNAVQKEVWCQECHGRWKMESTVPKLSVLAGNVASMAPQRSILEFMPLSSGAPQLTTPEVKSTSKALEIKCECGFLANQFTVKKEGPTKGRHFYKCPAVVCQFFAWDPVEMQALQAAFKTTGKTMTVEVTQDELDESRGDRLRKPVPARLSAVDECSGRGRTNASSLERPSIPSRDCGASDGGEEGHGGAGVTVKWRGRTAQKEWEELAPWMYPIQNWAQWNTAVRLQFRDEMRSEEEQMVLPNFWTRDGEGKLKFHSGILPIERPDQEVYM